MTISFCVGALVSVFIGHYGAISEYFYCPETKFVKVMSSQVSVCPRVVFLVDPPAQTSPLTGTLLDRNLITPPPLDETPPGQRPF